MCLLLTCTHALCSNVCFWRSQFGSIRQASKHTCRCVLSFFWWDVQESSSCFCYCCLKSSLSSHLLQHPEPVLHSGLFGPARVQHLRDDTGYLAATVILFTYPSCNPRVCWIAAELTGFSTQPFFKKKQNNFQMLPWCGMGEDVKLVSCHLYAPGPLIAPHSSPCMGRLSLCLHHKHSMARVIKRWLSSWKTSNFEWRRRLEWCQT